MAKVATLHEIETQWTLTDVMDAHEALDVYLEAEKEAYKRSKKD